MKSKRIHMADMYPVMKEVLESGGEFCMITAGTSMLPLLRDRRDSVILVSAPSELRKYDVILYIREDGSFVLHRIVGKNANGYILCGDNQYLKEYGIKSEQIVAVMKAYIKDGIRTEADDRAYMRYAVGRHRTRMIRRIYGFITQKYEKTVEKAYK